MSICSVSRLHRPTVYRIVRHHIQPQACGGQTVPGNLAAVCDSCHYTIHIVLHQLAITGGNVKAVTVGNRKQRAYAKQGYDACVAAGTVAKIPKESDL